MEKLLEIKNVNKKYPKFELKDVSFSIQKGKIVGFIGRNGAGKSTTLKGIMNLVHFDSGEVFAFEKPLNENELEAKQLIGFSLSDVNYYQNKKLKEIVNVTSRFYKNFDMNKFNRIAKHFNLDLDKKIEELSSGMKVKYSLAIALSYDAKLLILDEPTSGLDPISRDEVCDLFKEIVKNKERSILFSTHITSDLDKCAEDIIYIRNGQIAYDGTKEDFVDSYLVVKGNKSYFGEDLMGYFISYKDFDSEIEGLISITKKELFEKIRGISLHFPTLEEVMVFLEKAGGNYEEFTL